MGCVYILKNEAMPGLIKIGYTKENAKKRANELYTTGVPQPFEVAYELDGLEPEQSAKLEGEIHKELAQYRVNSKREFFEYPVDDAIRLLEKLHPSAIKESRHPRWLKWIPNIRGVRSQRNVDTNNNNGDTDESDPDEMNTTDTNIGGTFMHNENGNGVTPVMDIRKQQARTGLFLLKEAVIDVIVKEAQEKPIQLDAIRKHLGIHRVDEMGTARKNSLIYGILCQLQDEGRVCRMTGDGWQITDKESA